MSEARIDHLDGSIRDVDRRVAVLEQIARDTAYGTDRVPRRHPPDARRFPLLLRVVLGGFIGVLAVLAHGFHWI